MYVEFPMIIKLLLILALSMLAPAAAAKDYVYQGPWRTTNRKLEVTMTCVVTPVAKHEWRGHFSGSWQGAPFDYTLTFSGPASRLHGTATVDGAAYAMKGWITREQFAANFGGDRYTGSFDLKRANAPAQTNRSSQRF